MSWWRLIAGQIGISSSGSGSWERRVARELGADAAAGRSWSGKIANFLGPLADQGSWDKRLVDPATADLRASGYNIYNQGGLLLEEVIDAPALVFVGPSSDTTPALDVGGLSLIAEVDDLIEVQRRLSPNGDWGAYVTSAALTALQIAGDAITVSGATPLGEDDYDFRARLKRGALDGTWSNIVTGTVDAIAPAVSSIAITSSAGADNTYVAGNAITFSSTHNDTAIVAGGTPRLPFDLGGVTKYANYTGGTGTTTLAYSYTVQAGDTDTNGISVAANALELNGATIKDAAGNNHTLTHAEITTQAAHKVDTTAPTVSSLSPLDNATGVAITATLTATMSETVTLGASGTITLKKTSDNSTIDSWDVATDGGSGAGQVEVLTNTALTLHLTSNLANSIEYYVVWDSGVVKDAAGNPVAALSVTTTWSFTTVSAFTPFSFISATSVGSSDGNGPTTPAIDTIGAGILLVGIVSYESSTAPTPSDSKGNTWTPLTASSIVAGARSQLFYSVPTSVGSGHTVTVSGAGNFSSACFASFSGGAASPFDVENGGTGTSTSPSAGTGIAPTVDNELLIALAGTGAGTLTAIDGGFTFAGSAVAYSAALHFGAAMAYLIQTTATASDPNWTNSVSVDWSARIASLKVS